LDLTFASGTSELVSSECQIRSISGGAEAISKDFNAEKISARRRGAAAVNALLIVFLVGAAAGCSTSVDTYLIDPGHYSAYHCKQMVGRLKELQSRESELRNLMDKASEGGGGTVIGGMSYRANYEKAVGEEKVLRRTAADKNCALETPAFESDQVIR
jgi:hypothetical protein